MMTTASPCPISRLTSRSTSSDPNRLVNRRTLTMPPSVPCPGEPQLQHSRRYRAGEGKHEVDQGGDGQDLERPVRLRRDDPGLIHEVGDAQGRHERRVLEQADAQGQGNGNDEPEGLRENNEAHLVDIMKAEDIRGFDLVARHGLDSRPDGLAVKGPNVQGQGYDDGRKAGQLEPQDDGQTVV